MRKQRQALFCPTPGSVCITSTLRVQTECYGYFEYLPVEPVHCIRDERQ